MSGLDVGAHLLQDEGDDGGLHGQEEDVAALHRVLVAHREVNAHFLHRLGTNGTAVPRAARGGAVAARPPPLARSPSLTRSPLTVGRSVSGELAVILCAARTPANGNARHTVRLGPPHLPFAPRDPGPPAAVKPLARAKASCPAPMNPTLMAVRSECGADRSDAVQPGAGRLQTGAVLCGPAQTGAVLCCVVLFRAPCSYRTVPARRPHQIPPAAAPPSTWPRREAVPRGSGAGCRSAANRRAAGRGRCRLPATQGREAVPAARPSPAIGATGAQCCIIHRRRRPPPRRASPPGGAVRPPLRAGGVRLSGRFGGAALRARPWHRRSGWQRSAAGAGPA